MISVATIKPLSLTNAAPGSEAQILCSGWEGYAMEWKSDAKRGIEFLGDEWDVGDEGLAVSSSGRSGFRDYVATHLLDPYLPPAAAEAMEIGPGGGKLTAVLLGRTRILHAADISESMLSHVRRRFGDNTGLNCHRIDDLILPELRPSSLDFVFSYDTFVHFEPRLIYWYLRQIAFLLRPGGVGIIHYPNILKRDGWQQFEISLTDNVQGRLSYDAFGVMCPELMTAFLESLNFEIVSPDVEFTPRQDVDSVAVFRRRGAR